METILQYLGTITGILAISLISLFPKYMRQGIALNMVAAVLFMGMAYSTLQWGIFVSQFFYFIFGAIGLYTYRNGVTLGN